MLHNLTTTSNRKRHTDRQTEDWKWYEDDTTRQNRGWGAAASIGKDTAPQLPVFDPKPIVH